MKALPLLLLMLTLAVPGVSLSQNPTEAPANPSPEEAQNTNNTAPPPQPTPAATTPTATPQKGVQEPNLENTVEAAEPLPKRDLVHWNEYRGPHFTIRAGAGLLLDFAAFAQDAASKEQIAMLPGEKLRDFRFIMGGRFPSLPLPTTWCAGVMYDGATHSWYVRQTGIMVGIPKIVSYFFIGRQKEGFSLNKVMVGYDGWTMERATMSDATIPLLADGIKWLGYSKKHYFLWNLGYFNDVVSKGQSFSSYSSQEVARLAWLPMHSEEEGTLIHLGFNFRYGKPVDGQLRLKSRPEAFIAPFFLDTGTFAASSANSVGYETYYRRKSLLLGSEYYFMNTYSKTAGNQMFHGGDFVATWLITGETRPYNTVGGYFKDIAPLRTVFSGGPGAWELVFRYSYTNLDSHNVQGGTFGRFTPMVNWYLSENVRLEMAYGYGHLDRFNLKGNTQFFQTRLQLQF
jgi:phosphate-selective porin OprO and OprP